ncbi:MAG: diguanylate cyclase [Geobacteraceae bacterium]
MSLSFLVNGKFAFLDPAGMKFLGFNEQEELIGRLMVELVPSDYLAILAEQAKYVSVSGSTSPWIEARFIRRDGSDNISGERDAVVIAGRITESLAAPYYLVCHVAYLGVSIGISIYPGDGTDIDSMLKMAEIAMYRVKENGKNSYMTYADIEPPAA